MRCAYAENGVRRGHKIDVKEPGVDLCHGHAAAGRAVDGQHHFISTAGRRIARAKGRSKKAIGKAYIGRAKSETNRIRGITTQHAGTVERIGPDAVKGSEVAKQIHRQEIGVLSPAIVPHPELRVVAEERWVRRVRLYSVEGPRARHRVGALRHTNAFIE